MHERPRIGIVGVGLMGGAMARRLLDLGHAVTVHDIEPSREAELAAAGATVAAHPAALAAGVELLIVAVVDAAQTRRVLLDGAHAAAAALPAGATVMLCPTIAPADVEAVAAALAARGIDTIDAPMSGGPARARHGTMSLMVACSDAAWARWSPLLAQLAAHRFRIGTRPGDGARTKLVNNLLAAINLAGAAEAMALAERLGLDPALTLDVIERSSGQSWIASDRLRRAIEGDTAPRAALALLAKDAGLAMAQAAAAGLRLPIGDAAAERFASACRQGEAASDDSTLWQPARQTAPPPAQG